MAASATIAIAASITANLFYGLRSRAATLFSQHFSGQRSAVAIARPPGLRTRTKRCPAPAALGAIAAAALLAACNATFEPAAPPVVAAPAPALTGDHARLYFYRPDDSLFPAIRPGVIINGRKVGVSVVGEAFYRDAHPGRYEIFLTSDDDDRLTLYLAPGEVRYVKTSIALGWLGPHLSPTSVESDQGARELQNLVLVEPRLAD